MSKQQMLGGPETFIQQAGAVSELVVRAMAEGALKHKGGLAAHYDMFL